MRSQRFLLTCSPFGWAGTAPSLRRSPARPHSRISTPLCSIDSIFPAGLPTARDAVASAGTTDSKVRLNSMCLPPRVFPHCGESFRVVDFGVVNRAGNLFLHVGKWNPGNGSAAADIREIECADADAVSQILLAAAGVRQQFVHVDLGRNLFPDRQSGPVAVEDPGPPGSA